MTVISIHIPKTAGTSFSYVLQEQFGQNLFLDYDDRQGTAELPTELPEAPRCIHGHFRPEKYLGQLSSPKWITWLREPAQRVVSQYHQHLNHPEPDNPLIRKYFVDRRISLQTYISIPHFQNQMAREIAPLTVEDFFFIGFTEQFDRSLQQLSSLLDINLHSPVVMENRSKDKTGNLWRIDPETHMQIREYNRQDYALYFSAMDRFWCP